MKNKKLLWWGYLHANGSVQVKRWIPETDDLAHARMEKDKGNDLLMKIIDKPFEAENREVAFRKAIELLYTETKQERMSD